MFGLTSALNYYLYDQATDMRNGFDGLSGLVRNRMGREPLNGDVYIFINKRRNCIKLLRWEAGGFVLYYKRLESGTYELSFDKKQPHKNTLEWSELVMIIEGISVRNIRRRKRFILPDRTKTPQTRPLENSQNSVVIQTMDSLGAQSR